jgi:hypothetical protein
VREFLEGQKGDMATPAGLEPATCRLEGGCSIQLSYGARRALRRSGEFGGVLLT